MPDVRAADITEADDETILVAKAERGEAYGGDFVFQATPAGWPDWRGRVIDGIRGLAARSGNGVVGWGGNTGGNGMVGLGGPERGAGVIGVGGAAGRSASGGDGVVGVGNGDDSGKAGGIGVVGIARGSADAIFGTTVAPDRSGVYGFNQQGFLPETSGAGFGVFGRCDSGTGVTGFSTNGTGMTAFSTTGNAVYGRSDGTDAIVGDARPSGILNAAVLGITSKGRGVMGVVQTDRNVDQQSACAVLGIAAGGATSPHAGMAGGFMGSVWIDGDLTVFGAKHAAVPHRDGSHRLLHCVESPESWFEDFGEAKLTNGKAHIDLDRDFADLIRTDHYHVFVTPYGECASLYVTGRTATGFDVVEANNGSNEVAFSYRVVAKRKDLDGERLAKLGGSIAAQRKHVADLPSMRFEQARKAAAECGPPATVMPAIPSPPLVKSP